MCDPVTIGIAVAGVGLSLYGSARSAGAASDAANATARANQQMQAAQNTAFTQRMAATNRQTDAQRAAMNQTAADRDAAAMVMRQEQSRALEAGRKNLAEENLKAEALRRQGDTAAQTLITDTDAQAMQKQEANRIAAQNLLLDQNMPTMGPSGPVASNPAGVSEGTKAAMARRGAEAATNIREYGSKFANLAAYGEPMFGIGQAVAQNKMGIMPAQAADSLLRAGAPIRALPAQVDFRAAVSEGSAADELIRAQGQSQLDTAALQYSNDTGLATLGQQNANVTTKNALDQARADAAYKQAIAGIYSQLGNAAIQGAAYYGGLGAGSGAGPSTADQISGKMLPLPASIT